MATGHVECLFQMQSVPVEKDAFRCNSTRRNMEKPAIHTLLGRCIEKFESTNIEN